MPPTYPQSETEQSPINLPLKKIGLFMLLISLSMLFLAMSIGYVYTRNQNSASGVFLPPIFIVNSVILLLSSWFIHKANDAYLNDDTEAYQKALSWTMALTILFMIAQLIGWFGFKSALMGENVNGAGYLYALSGLHFAHIVGGLPFLAVFLYNAYKKMEEPMTVLLYFSDPDKRMNLELLTIYWHFLDGLWLFLVVFFLANMLI